MDLTFGSKNWTLTPSEPKKNEWTSELNQVHSKSTTIHNKQKIFFDNNFKKWNIFYQQAFFGVSPINKWSQTTQEHFFFHKNLYRNIQKLTYIIAVILYQPCIEIYGLLSFECVIYWSIHHRVQKKNLMPPMLLSFYLHPFIPAFIIVIKIVWTSGTIGTYNVPLEFKVRL